MQTTTEPTAQVAALRDLAGRLAQNDDEWRLTDKQAGFIRALVKERSQALPADIASQLESRTYEGPVSFTRVTASRVIDTLLTIAKDKGSPAPATVRAAAWSQLDALLKDVPSARYAIDPADVPGLASALPAGTTTFYAQVTRYKGRVYLRRLGGSPGGFFRTPVQLPVALAAAQHLSKDDNAARCAKRFADIHRVCARCAADLTVDRSVELGLGPTCAKSFGIEW